MKIIKVFGNSTVPADDGTERMLYPDGTIRLIQKRNFLIGSKYRIKQIATIKISIYEDYTRYNEWFDIPFSKEEIKKIERKDKLHAINNISNYELLLY